MKSDRSTIRSISGMSDQPDLSLDVIVLIVFGIFWLVFGLLLLRIYSGVLPYSPDSAYGLFLVICSFQMITMGKTPFGDLRRSWALVIVGTGTAILGISVCFIPGCLTDFVRTLVGIILFAGGAVLFLQLFLSKPKAQTWMKAGGALRSLTLACALVYALTIMSGLVTLSSGLRSDPRTAILVMLYGMSFLYLSWCVRKVGRGYHGDKRDESASASRGINRTESEPSFFLFRDASLPLSLAILILLGFMITLLGLFLFPVSLGMLPFSPDGQLGLTLTIMAIQMLAMGDTPFGQYGRSWIIIFIGILFAAFGVISCIVPGILTGVIRIFLGIMNIMSGSVFLVKQFLKKRDGIVAVSETSITVPPVVKKLGTTQTVLNSVTLAFGISMLLPGLVSGLIVGGILVINGTLLFMLASLVRMVENLQEGLQEQQNI